MIEPYEIEIDNIKMNATKIQANTVEEVAKFWGTAKFDFAK